MSNYEHSELVVDMMKGSAPEAQHSSRVGTLICLGTIGFSCIAHGSPAGVALAFELFGVCNSLSLYVMP